MTPRFVQFAVLVITCAAVQDSTRAQTPRPFRVMTWNIAAGHGDLTQTARVIRDVAPDILALQEVDVHWHERSRFADQTVELAAALGMRGRFAPIYQLPGAGAAPLREFGVAILTRHDILEFHNHRLARLSTQSAATEPELMPGFAEAIVDVGGTRVRVFSTHFDYRADRRVRDLQVTQTLEHLEAVQEPIVVMGDLNAPPDAFELAPLFQRLRDVWRESGDRGLTYPAATPVRRIDYILVSNELRALDVRVPVVESSDHRPVVADLVISQ